MKIIPIGDFPALNFPLVTQRVHPLILVIEIGVNHLTIDRRGLTQELVSLRFPDLDTCITTNRQQATPRLIKLEVINRGFRDSDKGLTQHGLSLTIPETDHPIRPPSSQPFPPRMKFGAADLALLSQWTPDRLPRSGIPQSQRPSSCGQYPLSIGAEFGTPDIGIPRRHRHRVKVSKLNPDGLTGCRTPDHRPTVRAGRQNELTIGTKLSRPDPHRLSVRGRSMCERRAFWRARL